jgi:hypothetical protein
MGRPYNPHAPDANLFVLARYTHAHDIVADHPPVKAIAHDLVVPTLPAARFGDVMRIKTASGGIVPRLSHNAATSALLKER